MAEWYRTGTVSVVNGDDDITFVGTLLTQQANEGDLIFLPDGEGYELDSIIDDTHAKIKQRNGTAAYAGTTASAQTYAILRNFTSTLPAVLANKMSVLQQKYLDTLDELADWLASEDDTVIIHNSGGIAFEVPTPYSLNGLLGGVLEKSVAGGAATHALTAVEARNTQLEFTGAITGNVIVTVPDDTKGLRNVFNNTTGAFTLTVKTVSGAGVTVTQGKRALLAIDDTVMAAQSTISGALEVVGALVIAGALTGATSGAFSGALSALTLALSGNSITMTAPAANSLVTIGNASANNATIIKLQPSNTQYNWQIDVNALASGAISFSPSTAVGGTTYSSTPTLQLVQGYTVHNVDQVLASTKRIYLSGLGVNDFIHAPSSGQINIYTAGTAALQITTSTATFSVTGVFGNVQVGAATSAYGNGEKLSVTQTAASSAGAGISNVTATNYTIQLWNKSATGDNAWVLFASGAGGTANGSVYLNRAGGVVVFATTSDYRAKQIFGPFTMAGMVIDDIPVHYGRMNTPGAWMNRPMFIAHEVQKWAPWAVSGVKDGAEMQTLDESFAIPILWAEMKSVRQRLAAGGL